jgi:hypothetical protein
VESLVRARSLLLVLLLSACTGGSSTPTARPSATVRPSHASAQTGIVVAVDGVDLSLFYVGRDRVAHIAETLAPPQDFYESHGVAISAGTRPTTCVLWSAQHTREIWCYPYGDTIGSLVVGADSSRSDIDAFALNPAGDRLAWAERPNLDAEGNDADDQDVVVAHLTGRTTVGEQRVPTFRPDGRGALGCRYFQVQQIAFAGQDLLLSCRLPDDDLVLQHLPAVRPGVPIPKRNRAPYNELIGIGSGTSRAAYALEGVLCDGDQDCAPGVSNRAVRFDPQSGEILDVIATPAAERELSYVSGGPSGEVYVTAGENGGQERLYWRQPGEKHGVLVTGLPTDAQGVVAQP